MIKLRNVKKLSSGILIMNDAAIEDFSYRQLNDFENGYFNVPHRLDIEKFVECYLGIVIYYYKLSFDRSILGATAIRDGAISIINDKGCLEKRTLKKGDICIDSDAYKMNGIFAFTVAHEAGHSQFDCNVNPKILNSNYLFHDLSFDLGERKSEKKKKGDLDWMEHHANRYAAYLLMPRVFVVRLWMSLFRGSNFDERLSVAQKRREYWALICKIARQLGVSNAAMAWRVKELGLITEETFSSLCVR